MKKKDSNNSMHEMPPDLQKALLTIAAAKTAWEHISPLARNEWICWVISAKKLETRERRIERTCSELLSGKRRPCCWPGCHHQTPE